MATNILLVISVKKSFATLAVAKTAYTKIKELLAGESGFQVKAYTSETHDLDQPDST